jgi:hypothetical protein
MGENLDEDLEAFDRTALIAEISRLRGGIRASRQQRSRPVLASSRTLGLLPEYVDPAVAVPPWPTFLRGCVAYREALERELPQAAMHEALIRSGPQAPASWDYPLLTLGVRLLFDPGQRSWSYADRSRSRGDA